MNSLKLRGLALAWYLVEKFHTRPPTAMRTIQKTALLIVEFTLIPPRNRWFPLIRQGPYVKSITSTRGPVLIRLGFAPEVPIDYLEHRQLVRGPVGPQAPDPHGPGRFRARRR